MKTHLNIPIEIVRTIVAITETGSYSKAAARLGLSQPAVSAQLKRIQQIIGGDIFTKTSNGSSLTDLGKLVLAQARKILEGNDQLLALGGADQGPQPVRIGLSNLMVREFMKHQSAKSLEGIQIHSDNSAVLAKSLLDGHVDIACFFENNNLGPDITPLIVDEFCDQLVWVRSKDFVLSSGHPIPILTWAGDDWMMRTLNQHGLSYRIVFSGQDYDAKRSAVEAGFGLSALPRRMIPPSLVWAKEYYLPPLPEIRGILCVRAGFSSDKAVEIQNQLSSLFFQSMVAGRIASSQK